MRSWNSRIGCRGPAPGLLSLALVGLACADPISTTHVQYSNVSAGYAHTCGLTRSGSVLCWGDNGSGQLGNGSLVSAARPVAVSGGKTFTQVSAGSSHTCGISQGAVLCWGSNLNGQVGNGAAPDGPAVQIPAAVVPPASNPTFKRVATGDSFSCAITTGGEAYCWGQTVAGKLGTDGPVGHRGPPADLNESITVPTKVVSNEFFTWISAGGDNACALTSTNKVYCWGQNLFHQLGVNSMGETCDAGSPSQWPCSKKPVLIPVPGIMTRVSVGLNHTCAKDDAYNTFCWGDNAYQQIVPKGALSVCNFVNGLQSECSPAPIKVPRPTSPALAFVDVTTGGHMTCSSVYPTGSGIVCWGTNSHGELGDGTTVARGTPGAQSVTLGALDLSAGGSHACLVTDGLAAYQIHCWGSNSAGQLGNGKSGSDELTPQQVLEP